MDAQFAELKTWLYAFHRAHVKLELGRWDSSLDELYYRR
jgi:hypothetical protein